MTIRLSKSRLIAFRQCHKRMWLEINQPELRVEDAAARRRSDIGHRIGEIARSQLPGGVLVAPDNDLGRALVQTAELLARTPRQVLFEATFEADGLLVRADLLVPQEHGWHLVEVKSATQVKDYHLEDAAIQGWVVTQAGLDLERTSVQVVDSGWTYPGGDDYAGLLKAAPIDAAISSLRPEVPKWLEAAKATAAGAEPDVKMGRQCGTPFACSFQAYCGTLTTPAQFPIAWLPNLHHTKRAGFEAQGFRDMREVPVGQLSDRQRRVVQATVNDEPFLEPLSPGEAESFAGVRFYLDFETAAFAVPIWAGTRPYQQVPFQWSCHIEQPDGATSHDMFLDLSGDDPSRGFAESLLRVLGDEGPIVVYNQSFEKRVIGELAERFDDLQPALSRLLDRVLDLLPLVSAHFYHPSMRGSWSIKAVLPAIAPELDYAELEDVAGGIEAMDAYTEAIDAATSAERKVRLEQALREYCRRDTQAMIVVLHHLLGDEEAAMGAQGCRRP